MNKDFRGFDHGSKHIELVLNDFARECRPIEIHHKSDGAADDTPLFCIVMVDGFNRHFYGQISLKMLNEGLEEIGYKIKPL